MSTLPQLFRSNTNSCYLQPTKQGGIFTIKFKQSNKFETVHHKFSQSRAGTSCTNRTQKTNRHSVCFGQRPFSRQSINSQGLQYGNSKMSFAISENRPNVQQADSLKHKLNEQLQEMKHNERFMEKLSRDRQQLAESLTEMKQQIEFECEQIDREIRKRINVLSGMLSEMRRESGMETKVNRQDGKQMEEDLRIIGMVLEDIQDKVFDMQSQCIK